MQTAFAVKGNLFYTPVCGELARHPGAYLVCENGTVAGILTRCLIGIRASRWRTTATS